MWRHRGKKTSTKREDVRTYIPFQRVKAEIQNEVTKAIVEGRVFLNDLSASGVGLFTPTPLVTGDKVSIVIEEPKHIFIKGKVIWCAQYTMSTKIISSTENFTYRVGIKFIFDSEEERNAVKEYCNSLYENPI